MIRFSLFVFIIGCACSLQAQLISNEIDNDYIERIESKWIIGGQIGTFQDRRSLENKTADLSYELYSNVQPSIGVYLQYKNWPGLKLSIPISSENDSTRTTSKGFKLGLHISPVQSIIADIYYSRLKRFNLEYNQNNVKIVLPLTDVVARNFAINTYYVFNHTRFSYKYPYSVGQKQVENAGSWMVGVSMNSTRQEKSTTVFDAQNPSIQLSDFKSIEALQFALLGGYVYNWIIGSSENGFISAGLFLGPNFHTGNISYQVLEEDNFSGLNYSAKFLLSGGFQLDNLLQLQFKVFVNDYGYDLPEVDMRNGLLDGELSIVKYLE